MRRIPLTAVVCLSLFACMATLALSAGSYFWVFKAARYSRAYDGDALHTLQVSLFEARLILARSSWSRGGDAMTRYEFNIFGVDTLRDWDVDRTRLGFGWLSERNPPDMVDWFLQVVSVPLWPFTVCLGVATYIGGRRIARRRAGCCMACHYDLRATKGPCPECGHPASTR